MSPTTDSFLTATRSSSLLKNAEHTENALNRLTSLARSLLIYMDSGSHCVWPERRSGVQCRVFQQAARNVFIVLFIIASAGTTAPTRADEALTAPNTTLNIPADNQQNLDTHKTTEAQRRAELQVSEQKFGPESEQTLIALQQLAKYLDSEPSQRKELLAVVERLLPLVKTLRGNDHVETGTALGVYGSALAHAKQDQQAEPLLLDALTILQRHEGRDNETLLDVLDSLAAIHQRSERAKSALDFTRQSLVIRESILPPNQHEIAVVLNNLAVLYHTLGQTDTALPLMQRAVALDEIVLKPEDPEFIEHRYNLAAFYRTLGQYDKAVPLLERNLVINEKTLGPEQPGTANCMEKLALVYNLMGHYDQSMILNERLLSMYENAPDPRHLDTAAILNNLAVLHYMMGQTDKAVPLMQRALAIYENMRGPDHPDTLDSINKLAEFHASVSQYDQALPLYQRSLAINETIFGPEHPNTAVSLTNLAMLYKSMRQFNHALPLLQRSLAIREKILPPDDPDITASLIKLALIYSALDQPDKAAPLFQRSLAIHEETLGFEHPNTANGLNNLGYLYLSLGKLSQAEAMFQAAVLCSQDQLAARETLWKAQHGLTLLYKKMDQPDRAILWGKATVNTIQGLRSELTHLDKELQSSFLNDKRAAYQNLADLLIAEGRIVEAQDVLQVLMH